MKIRRFLRYSLRTMLVVVLLLSVWLGWMANKAAKQRQAVALVEEFGGKVFYDDQVRITATAKAAPSPTIELIWFRPKGPLYDLLGIDSFHNVAMVHLFGPAVTDEQLGEVVGGLHSIGCLALVECSITDAGLEHLASLKKLEVVFLHGTNVTEEGVARLRDQLPDGQVVYTP